jgi:hypothetical protein
MLEKTCCVQCLLYVLFAASETCTSAFFVEFLKKLSNISNLLRSLNPCWSIWGHNSPSLAFDIYEAESVPTHAEYTVVLLHSSPPWLTSLAYICVRMHTAKGMVVCTRNVVCWYAHVGLSRVGFCT